MDWLNQHIELMAYVAGAVLTFTVWNVRQGDNIKSVGKDLGEFKLQVVQQFQAALDEVKAVRVRQDAVEKGLFEELRRIGEKLAHIEGFLTARRPSQKKS